MMTGTSGRTSLALGNSSSPLIPGMLISDKINMSEASLALLILCNATGADCANSMVKRPARRSRRKCCRNSISTSGSSSTTRIRSFTRVLLSCQYCCLAWKNDAKFGVFSSGSVDIDRSAVLFDDDVVADREAQPRALARGLGGEERVEHLLPHLGRNAVAIVANPDFDAVTEVFRRSRQRGFVATGPNLRLALCRSIEAVRNQVEEYPRDLLWKEIGLACGGVE